MPETPSFLSRLLDATKIGREDLRKALGLSRAEMDMMEGANGHELPNDLDPFWHELLGLVDYRLGLYMAVKLELNKKLEKSRKARLVRQAAMRTR